MIVKMNGTSERDAKLNAILPKRKLTEQYLLPALKKAMAKPLLSALKRELKIYRSFPKDNGTLKLDSFEPRNGSHCFMGQAFMSNGRGGMIDADLVLYRKRIGTLPHTQWGNCTVLEIWAADHYETNKDMVIQAFEYGWSKRSRMPKLYFKITPFLITAETGQSIRTPQDEEDDKAGDALILQLAEVKARKLLEEWKDAWLRRHHDD